MPTLIDRQNILIDWADIDGRVKHPKPKGSRVRSSGWHLMGIVKHALTTAGLMDTYDTEDMMPLRMAVGMAWEDWSVGLWPELVWQPGELELDQVFGTPDGYGELSIKGGPDGTGDYPMIEEFKCTWKSSHTRKDITTERIWMWQLAGLCKMSGTNYARLHVLWINGDYRRSGPIYNTYVLQFTQPELDKFWANVILKNRDQSPKEEH